MTPVVSDAKAAELTAINTDQVNYPQPPPATADRTTLADLRVRAAGLRDQVQLLNADVTEVHRQTQDYDLGNRAAIKARGGVGTLLTELSENAGLGWNDIATAVGVSVGAVRKWRMTGVVSPDNMMSLARVAAVMDLLKDFLVSDPAGFLLLPVVDGATLRHIDLISARRDDLVLDVAANRRVPSQALDEFDPDWRERHTSQFEVVTDAEGERSIRRRSRR